MSLTVTLYSLDRCANHDTDLLDIHNLALDRDPYYTNVTGKSERGWDPESNSELRNAVKECTISDENYDTIDDR